MNHPLRLATIWFAAAIWAAAAKDDVHFPPPLDPLVTFADLALGETRPVTLSNGRTVSVQLVALNEIRDPLRHAVREATVDVKVDNVAVRLVSATYHLPTLVREAGVQIDCPVTQGYNSTRERDNGWGLRKAARVRLWPAGSDWVRPETFAYPVRQRWFASATQMANEPVFVDGGDTPTASAIGYHSGLDFGGAEQLVEVVAATEGLVISAAGKTLPNHSGPPIKGRHDMITIVDGRGWYYTYLHLAAVFVEPGQTVHLRERIGLLGKEGGSGGWSHLHLEIISRQPSGEWGVQDGYAYVWAAYRREFNPAVIAVARPHQLASVGEAIRLDGLKSWSRDGAIRRYQWTFTDGATSSDAVAVRTYERPGTYSETLQVTDDRGQSAWDFCTVQVLDPAHLDQLPPSIHAACFPTRGIRAGDEVTFKVRTFRTEPTGETWDFGDGSPRQAVRSDADVHLHAPDGYAVTTHRYKQAGHYIARVEHENSRHERAIAHLVVEVAAAP